MYGNAYALRERIPVTPEKNTGPELTKPGMAVMIADAQKRYSVPTLASQLKTYYVEEGMMPLDFERMDRIEQLIHHSNLRRDTKEKFEEAQRKVREMDEKEKQEDFENAIKKAEERGKRAASQSKTSNKTEDNETSSK